MTELFTISEALSIGLHVCLRLAGKPGVFCSTREIADEFGFSYHHVAKIVQKLAHAGLVETARGACGGTRLARDPYGIALREILAALGAALHTGCMLDPRFCSGDRCRLGKLIREQGLEFWDRLGGFTLGSVAESFDNDTGKTPGPEANIEGTVRA